MNEELKDMIKHNKRIIDEYCSNNMPVEMTDIILVKLYEEIERLERKTATIEDI